MKMKSKILKMLAAFLLFSLLTVMSGAYVFADPLGDSSSGTGDDNLSDWDDAWNTASGKCGDTMTWTLDNSNGALVISGSGDMWARLSHEDQFWNAGEVKSVSFSGDISTVGSGAFLDSTQLAKVVLPRSVKKIGDRAFDGCSSLRRAEFFNTVQSIGMNCFAGCGVLTDLYFTGSNQDWKLLTDGAQTALTSNTFLHFVSTISVKSQPSDVKVSSGSVAKFSVTAEGKGTLCYQWFYRKKGAVGWNIWKGHTTAVTVATSNDTWEGMQLYCRIEDSENFISSDTCTVTLSAGVKIITQPSDVTVQSGEEASFTVKAQGDGLKYQWYYRKYGGSTWNIWKGHTSATTTARANDTWDGMQVYCKVNDNTGSSVNSQLAVIKLAGMPKILTQPAAVVVRTGEEASFTVKAQGIGLKYQWYYKKHGASSWNIWKGHTTATTKARANDTWNGMQVYCKITDGLGRTVSSAPAVIKLV